MNLYEDSYEMVLKNTLQDPLTLSYIEKGSYYREQIVSEVSPRAVTLMKAVSVRDYASNCIFYDQRVALYYTIRVLQDYLKEGRVYEKKLLSLPDILQECIKTPKKDLIKFFTASSFDVVEQEIGSHPSEVEFRDFLGLLKLGHFDVNRNSLKKAITYYNVLKSKEEKISSLNDLAPQFGAELERRLTDRFIKIKNLSCQTAA